MKPLDHVCSTGAYALNPTANLTKKSESDDSILKRLIEFAVSVPDFRRSDKGNIRHRLSDIIILIILARMVRNVSRTDIIAFGNHNLKKFRAFGLLRNGVPLLLAVFVLYRMIRRGHMRELGTQRVENALARSENIPVSQDERFITDAKNAIECNLAREDFGVEELSAALTMSRSNLYKKMMEVAGQTPLEFIRRIRMREGRKLLDGGETSVSQIAYAIGMSPKQFSKYFRDETGMTPTQYIKQRHG